VKSESDLRKGFIATTYKANSSYERHKAALTEIEAELEKMGYESQIVDEHSHYRAYLRKDGAMITVGIQKHTHICANFHTELEAAKAAWAWAKAQENRINQEGEK
jgi:hypothetical protein